MWLPARGGAAQQTLAGNWDEWEAYANEALGAGASAGAGLDDSAAGLGPADSVDLTLSAADAALAAGGSMDDPLALLGDPYPAADPVLDGEGPWASAPRGGSASESGAAAEQSARRPGRGARAEAAPEAAAEAASGAAKARKKPAGKAKAGARSAGAGATSAPGAAAGDDAV